MEGTVGLRRLRRHVPLRTRAGRRRRHRRRRGAGPAPARARAGWRPRCGTGVANRLTSANPAFGRGGPSVGGSAATVSRRRWRTGEPSPVAATRAEASSRWLHDRPEGLILSARRGARSGGYTLTLDDALAEAVDGAPRSPRRGGRRRRRRDRDTPIPGGERPARPRDPGPAPAGSQHRRGRQGRPASTPSGSSASRAPVFAERAAGHRPRSGRLRCGGPGSARRCCRSVTPFGTTWPSAGSSQSPDEFAAAWTARQSSDGRWAVRFTFHHRGQDQVLRFDLDDSTGEVSTADRLSSLMGYVAPRTSTPTATSADRTRAGEGGTGGAPGRQAGRREHGLPAGSDGEGRVAIGQGTGACRGRPCARRPPSELSKASERPRAWCESGVRPQLVASGKSRRPRPEPSAPRRPERAAEAAARAKKAAAKKAAAEKAAAEKATAEKARRARPWLRRRVPQPRSRARRSRAEEGAPPRGRAQEGAGQEGELEEGAGQEGDAPKKAPAKKASAKKASAKNSGARTAPTKQAPATRAVAKKATATTPPVKQSALRATATGSTVRPSTIQAVVRPAPARQAEVHPPAAASTSKAAAARLLPRARSGHRRSRPSGRPRRGRASAPRPPSRLRCAAMGVPRRRATHRCRRERVRHGVSAGDVPAGAGRAGQWRRAGHAGRTNANRSPAERRRARGASSGAGSPAAAPPSPRHLRWSSPHVDELRHVGLTAGLDVVEVASAEPFVDVRSTLIERKAAGLHGGMAFTYRHAGPVDRSRSCCGRCPSPGRGRPELPGRGADVGTGTSRRAGWPATPGTTTTPHCATGLTAVATGPEGGRLAGPGAGRRQRAGRPGRRPPGRDRLVGQERQPARCPGSAAGTCSARWSPTRRSRRPPGPVADGCGACTRCISTAAPPAPSWRPGWSTPAAACRGCSRPKGRSRASTGSPSATGSTAATSARRSVRRTGGPRAARRRARTGRGSPLLALLDDDDAVVLGWAGRWYIPRREVRYVRRNALVVLGNVGDGVRSCGRGGARAATSRTRTRSCAPTPSGRPGDSDARISCAPLADDPDAQVAAELAGTVPLR